MTMCQPLQPSRSLTTSRRLGNLSTLQVQCMRIMKQASISEWRSQSHRQRRHHPARPEASFASILLGSGLISLTYRACLSGRHQSWP